MDPISFSLRKITDITWVAFDTEATGYSNVTDELVEVAGVRFRRRNGEWVELDRFSELVRPRKSMPESVIRIHGIRDRDVAGAAPAAEVLGRFFSFAKDAVLLAHYAPFDVGVISFANRRAKRPTPEHFVLDTFFLAKSLIPGLEHYSLSTCAAHFGFTPDVTHRALPDAVTTRALFERCVERIGDPDTLLVGALLEHCGGPITFEDFASISDEIPENLGSVGVALDEGRDLSMVYRGGSRGQTPRRVTPTHLFARDGHLFLEGICHIDGSRKSFRVDRIVSAELGATVEDSSGTTS